MTEEVREDDATSMCLSTRCYVLCMCQKSQSVDRGTVHPRSWIQPEHVIPYQPLIRIHYFQLPRQGHCPCLQPLHTYLLSLDMDSMIIRNTGEMSTSREHGAGPLFG